ncbi:MAG: hypothetical protein N2513_07970 [Deltaproteobacteria bacterium]|nr:hypothetical protein [Deltaproteobacteria bacterium]
MNLRTKNKVESVLLARPVIFCFLAVPSALLVKRLTLLEKHEKLTYFTYVAYCVLKVYLHFSILMYDSLWEMMRRRFCEEDGNCNSKTYEIPG